MRCLAGRGLVSGAVAKRLWNGCVYVSTRREHRDRFRASLVQSKPLYCLRMLA